MSPPALAISAPTPRFAEKRELILDGAARLFNRRGIKAGTLAEVAEHVGLATNSLTYYYRRKEDLVCACLLRAIETLMALVAEADAEPDMARRVECFVHRFVDRMARTAAGELPELIFFSDMRALPLPQAQPVFDAFTNLFRAVRRLLRDAPESAEGPGLPHDLARTGLNARAHLLMSLTVWSRAWLGRYEPADHGHAAHWLADIVLHGLAAPGQPWPQGDVALNRLSAVAPAGSSVAGACGPSKHLPTRSAQAELWTDPIRDAYLRTATRRINAQGVGGASVEAIAGDLALTKGSFYHHHPTKHDLVAACFERTFSVIRRAQVQADAWAAAHGASGWQRLLQAVLPLARFQLSADGPLLRVTSWAALPSELRADHFSAMNRLAERFGIFIVGGMADGSVRVLDPGVAAQQINGMINGLAEIEHWVPGVNADNVATLYARPLLWGLMHPGGP